MGKKKILAKVVSSLMAFATVVTVTPGALNAAAGDIKVGVNYELSGDVQVYGQASVEGIQVAFDEINKGGGINGKKVTMVKMDTRSDLQEAVNTAKKLVSNEKVAAMIGPATSGAMKAVREVAEKYKVPTISGSTTAEDVTVKKDGKTYGYIFRTCFADSFQGHSMAMFATKNLKVKKVAMLVDNSTDYSKGLAKYFKSTFTKNKGKIIKEENFTAQENDFRAVLASIRSSKPDAIYLPAYTKEAGKIIKQAREMNIKVPILGGDGFGDPEIVKLAGKGNMKDVYFTNHYSPDSTEPEVAKFKKAYKAKFGKEPNAFAALAYDAAKLMFDAMKRAGSTDPDKIKAALENTKDYKGVTGKISIDGKHNSVKSTVIIKLDGAKSKYVTTVAP